MNWFKFKLLQCGDVTYPPSSFCFDAFLGQEFFCFSKNNFVRSLCYFVINKSHIRSAWLKWRHYFDLMYQEFKKLFCLCLEKCIALQQYLNQQNKRVLCKTNCKELGLEQKNGASITLKICVCAFVAFFQTKQLCCFSLWKWKFRSVLDNDFSPMIPLPARSINLFLWLRIGLKACLNAV